MNITELKELAEKATQGDWTAAGPSFGKPLPRYCNEVIAISDDDEETQVCRTPEGLEDVCTDDMRFIAAANPAAILELITQLEDAQGEIRALRATEAGVVERVKELEEGLEKIRAIEHQMNGPDWEEIEEAQDIARALLEKKE